MEVGTGDGVGLPGLAGRAGKASTVLGVERVGFGGVGGGLGMEAAVVGTDGSGGKASLLGEVDVPGLAVLVGTPTGVTAFAVVTDGPTDLAVEVGTVTADLAVVLAVVGASVVVLSFFATAEQSSEKATSRLLRSWYRSCRCGFWSRRCGGCSLRLLLLSASSEETPEETFFLGGRWCRSGGARGCASRWCLFRWNRIRIHWVIGQECYIGIFFLLFLATEPLGVCKHRKRQQHDRCQSDQLHRRHHELFFLILPLIH